MHSRLFFIIQSFLLDIEMCKGKEINAAEHYLLVKSLSKLYRLLTKEDNNNCLSFANNILIE